MTTITVTFFNTLGISFKFLDLSVEDWPQAENFHISKSVINNFKVNNDVTERGVKLMEDKKLLKNNEEQKQYSLQVVSDYRKKLNHKLKQNIIATMAPKNCNSYLDAIFK